MEEKIENMMQGWKGESLLIGDKATLINACLSSIPLSMQSFLEVPKGVAKRWDHHRARMLW